MELTRIQTPRGVRGAFASSRPTRTWHAIASPVRPVPSAACPRRYCREPLVQEEPNSIKETSAPTHPGRRDVLLGSLMTLSLLLPANESSAAAIDTVFVAGSTGNTGRRVVQQLRAAGYRVRAGVRDVKKAQSLGFGLDAGIELLTVDVTKGSGPLVSAIGPAQAVVCATGYTGFNPGGFGNVDETGTMNLVDAAKAAGASKFVLISSLLTNAPAVGQADNPNYKFLNLFGGVLDHKLVAEKYLRQSGLDWTIVRPGGLSNEPPAAVGNLVVGREDSLFGLPGDPGREISRDTVAAVLVAALAQPGASDKVLEVVAAPGVPELPQDEWFP